MAQILHITPQLSPTRCGVSDYALEWIAQQAEAGTPGRILALCDRFHTGITEHTNGLRLGADVPVAQKILAVQQALQQGPRGVVLHYVPMGYDGKALPLWLLQTVKLLRGLSCPVVVVLHELWAGGAGKPFPLRLKGRLQKWLLLRWLRQLPRARLITTSAYTAAMLRQQGLQADWCPVFSNLGSHCNATQLPEIVRQVCDNDAVTKVLLFGSLPPEGSPDMVAALLAQMHKRQAKKVQVWHAGHGYRPGWWESVAADLAAEQGNIHFATIGPLPAAALNALMQACHYGISTYPVELWSKSGSIAAMRANGLPVLIPGGLANSMPPRGYTPPEGLYPLLPPNDVPTPSPAANPALYNRHIAERVWALSGMQGGTSLYADPCSVLITVYRSWNLAHTCVQSVRQWLPHARIGEILLVHDDPATEAPAWTRTIPNCRVLQNSQNLGYVASVQKGVEAAQYEPVWLLDADAAFTRSALQALDLLMGAPDVHMVVPAATDRQGKPVPRFYKAPSPVSLWLGQKAESCLNRFYRGEKMVSHSYGWLLRRSTFLDVGGFDTRLRFLEADVDFSIRLHATYTMGTVFYPLPVVTHEGGANPITRNQRVMDWYGSRWFLLQKQGKLKQQGILRQWLQLRLWAEQMMAYALAYLQKGKKIFWQQKAEGRKILRARVASGFQQQ